VEALIFNFNANIEEHNYQPVPVERQLFLEGLRP
jgi:hypothetical protein